jgi:hypothetical protein
MATVRRRSTASSGSTKTASRRRDRVAEEEDDDEEDEDATPPRRRTSAKSTTRRRRPEPVDEEEDDDEDEEEPPPVRKKRRPAPEPEEDDEDDEDEEEEPPPPRRKKRRAPVEEDDDDDEDDEDDDEPPRRSRAAAAKKTSSRTRTTKSRTNKLPPGIRTGVAGVEATAAAGGGGEGRIKLTKTPILVKIIEKEPLMSFRQHWLSQGKGQGDRGYVCIGKPECPACKYGDRAALSVIINVLNFSVEGEPQNMYLQIGKRAWDSLSEQATDAKGVLRLEKGLWSFNKTGTGTSSQTNVKPVKERDVEEDWPEVVDEDVDFEAELPELVKEAKKNLFGTDIVQTHTKKQLAEVSKYMADDEDDDDEDEDDDE